MLMNEGLPGEIGRASYRTRGESVDFVTHMMLGEITMRTMFGAALLLSLASGVLAQDLPPVAGDATQEQSPITDLAAATPKVNLYYCVPNDKHPNQNYINAMNVAGTSLVGWYASQVPGHKTFGLANPIVQVVLLPHDSTYYANNPRSAIFTQFWDNVLGDVFPLTGGKVSDPLNVYAHYVEVDPMCNQCGGFWGPRQPAVCGAGP